MSKKVDRELDKICKWHNEQLAKDIEDALEYEARRKAMEIVIDPDEMPVRQADKYVEKMESWGQSKEYSEACRQAWLAGWDYCRELVRSKTEIKI